MFVKFVGRACVVDPHGVLMEFSCKVDTLIQVVLVPRIKACSMASLVLPGLSLFRLLA